MTRLLITGCARSGTKYIATLLHNAGIKAVHESRGVGDVDVSSDAGLDMKRLLDRDVKAVGHIVRSPQDVVASIVGRGMLDAGWGINIREAYPILDEYQQPIDKALAYWLCHNERLEEFGAIRFRLSAPLGGLVRLLYLAGLPTTGLSEARAIIRRDLNHDADNPPIVYEWSDHDPELRVDAERMCERYGLAVGRVAV